MKKQLVLLFVLASASLVADESSVDPLLEKLLRDAVDAQKQEKPAKKKPTMLEQLTQACDAVQAVDWKTVYNGSVTTVLGIIAALHEQELQRAELDPNFTPWS